MDPNSHIYRPKPRRPFQHSSIALPQEPPSPLLMPTPADFDETPSRTHSILNLTSSTLGGIYSPTGFQSEESSTPWGTGSQTPLMDAPREYKPVRRASSIPPAQLRSKASTAFALVLRSVLLFGMGMGYGLLVRHLHDNRQLAPFQVEGIIQPTENWRYLLFWGIAGVALGSLMPYFDTLFEPDSDVAVLDGEDTSKQTESLDSDSIFGADWTPVVRSVGAFVGIAFAIRKLSWSSTLQASLTLALVNPVLWYLIDRSKPGFILSSAVGATGAALMLVSNPDMMPSPKSANGFRTNSTRHQPLNNSPDTAVYGLVSRESLEGGIWILSVLFCSCVCFGNIGRRLALSGMGRKKSVGTGMTNSRSR